MAKLNLSVGAMAIIAFVISGITVTFTFKLMSTQQVYEGGIRRNFYHPFMSTLIMTIGQLLCLGLYYLKKKQFEIPIQDGKSPHKFSIFIVPGIAYSIMSAMQFTALNFISGSSYQIFQGGSIITTLLFSKILLKYKIERWHIIGIILAMIGLAVVGVLKFLTSGVNSDNNPELEKVGYSIMTVSIFISGFVVAYEQRLMHKHTLNALEMIGWEGFFGFIFTLPLSLILTFIPCGLKDDLCVYDRYGDKYFERFDEFFVQITQNWVLGLLVIVGIISMAFSDTSGRMVTKYYDGILKALITVSKTAGIWVIGLIITFSVKDNLNFQLESKDLLDNLIQVVGFGLIILGNLVYNQLVLRKFFEGEQKSELLTKISEDYQKIVQSNEIKREE